MDGRVELRDVVDGDLPVFFEQQREPEGARMAAFASRDRDAFAAHWARILADPACLLKTIVHDGAVAGNIGSFDMEGERLVGYWIGRAFWGRGIATRALALFLEHEPARPLFAHVARHNVASIRVLEKCGFAVSGESTGDDGITELIMRRDA